MAHCSMDKCTVLGPHITQSLMEVPQVCGENNLVLHSEDPKHLGDGF